MEGAVLWHGQDSLKSVIQSYRQEKENSQASCWYLCFSTLMQRKLEKKRQRLVGRAALNCGSDPLSVICKRKLWEAEGVVQYTHDYLVNDQPGRDAAWSLVGFSHNIMADCFMGRLPVFIKRSKLYTGSLSL